MEVKTIRLGSSNVHFIRTAVGYLMVDAGSSGNFNKLMRFLRKEKIRVCDIRYVFITHVHHDHVGNLKDLMAVSDAKVIAHELEKEYLEQGIVKIPDGIGFFPKLIAALGRGNRRVLRYKACNVDFPVHSSLDLHSMGFPGKVFHTPGHTEGSLSLIFDDGDAFVGDTCFSLFRRKKLLPPFVNDLQSLYHSWELLNNKSATRFYPGHGKPFGIRQLHQSMERLKRKLA